MILNLLKTYTTPSNQEDIFHVFWTNSTIRLAGLLKVKVSADIEDKPIAAELDAIRHLLEERCVLGKDISGGAGIKLSISSGAIKKLQHRQSSKQHLAPYANFLCTRYAACLISVEKDVQWFTGKQPEHVEELLVCAPHPEMINVNGLGDVMVTRHVLDRFVTRILTGKPSSQALPLAWKHLRRIAEHKSVREVTRKGTWASIAYHSEGRKEGRYFLNPGMNTVLVVTENPAEGPRLVTAYPASKNFHPLHKTA